MPVVEAFLFGFDQRFARVAVFVEVFGETAFSAGEADEVIDFVRLGFDEEIRFLGWIALEAEALRDLVAFARIVDQHRERARVHGLPREIDIPHRLDTRCLLISQGEFALLHRHVVCRAAKQQRRW